MPGKPVCERISVNRDQVAVHSGAGGMFSCRECLFRKCHCSSEYVHELALRREPVLRYRSHPPAPVASTAVLVAVT